MPWSQVSEDRWERPCDIMEVWFRKFADMTRPIFGRELLTVYTRLKINIAVIDL